MTPPCWPLCHTIQQPPVCTLRTVYTARNTIQDTRCSMLTIIGPIWMSTTTWDSLIIPPDNPSPLCIQSYIPSVSDLRNGGVCQRTTYEHSVPAYAVPVLGMMSLHTHRRSVKRVKVVGLNGQTSQGRGIDVTTSPDFPALETTPGRNVNSMPLSTLLSLLLLNSQITSLTLPRKRR